DGAGLVDVLLRRPLGLDAKLAQYRQGAAFVRGVLDAVGHAGLNAAWTGPEQLPPAAEIADPAARLRRVHGCGRAAPAAAAPVDAVGVAVRDLLDRLLAAGSLGTGDLVLVACSGGPDSVALASQVAFLAPRLQLRAGAVVVDHGLLPGSAAAASETAAGCDALGLDPVVVRTAPDGGRATETAAREARYAELEDARAAIGAVGVLLGHTLDDQAESVLLALGRGSGTRTLAGMAEVRGPFWRPLLGVRRAETL